jgi:hypothetical protein
MRELRARAGVLTGRAAVDLGRRAKGDGARRHGQHRFEPPIDSHTGGPVLVDVVTRRANEAAIAYEDAAVHKVKGREQPVHAWTALRVVAGAGGARRAPAAWPLWWPSRSAVDDPPHARDQIASPRSAPAPSARTGSGGRVPSPVGLSIVVRTTSAPHRVGAIAISRCGSPTDGAASLRRSPPDDLARPGIALLGRASLLPLTKRNSAALGRGRRWTLGGVRSSRHRTRRAWRSGCMRQCPPAVRPCRRRCPSTSSPAVRARARGRRGRRSRCVDPRLGRGAR